MEEKFSAALKKLDKVAKVLAFVSKNGLELQSLIKELKD